MKTLARLVALTSVCLFTALIPVTHAAPLSPVGEWDFVMTGKQRGIALITFDPGYTLFGSEILRPAPTATATSATAVDPRNPSGTVASRTGGSTTATNGSSSTSTTNFFGSADLDGVWTYDSTGRIIGSLREIYYTRETRTTLQTNVVDGSNYVTSVTADYYVSHNIGVSFLGVVGAGGRMTINVYTPRGLSTFQGVQATALPDYSGNYYTVASKDRPFVEFFTAASSGLAGGYNVDLGVGAGYLFTGNMLVSKQKQVAIVTQTDSGALSVCTGLYKTNRFTGANAITGVLQGTDGVRMNYPCQLSPRP